MSGFKRAIKKENSPIPGTKILPNKNCMYISSGLSSLDTILGGGIPVGTLTLIDEDTTGFYAEVLSKYYLSEGVLSNHNVIIASIDTKINDLIQKLPGENQTPDESIREANSDDMTIAWRYQNLKLVDPSIGNKQSFGHNIDLNTALSQELLESKNVSQWSDINGSQSDLINFIENVIEKNESKTEKTITRLAILQLGSPLWDPSQLTKTLFQLKIILRRSHSAGLVSICGRSLQDRILLDKCIHISDCFIRLEDFSSSVRDKNPALKDFHGVFKVIKLAPINSIVSQLPLADLAFKLRRSKFIIETLHLPPESEDSMEREQDENVLSCSLPGKSSKLDF